MSKYWFFILALLFLFPLACTSINENSNSESKPVKLGDTMQIHNDMEGKIVGMGEIHGVANPRILQVFDSLGFQLKWQKENSLKYFIENNKLPFAITKDTILNDTRGIYLGPRATFGASFVQWEMDSTVAFLKIYDDKILFSEKIHCGMLQNEFDKVTKINSVGFDEVSFQFGFVWNFTSFVFLNGKLVKIEMVNLPD